MANQYQVTVGGRPLWIETGKLAGQANGAVTVRYGNTVVLATATASRKPRLDADFFPLTVDYEERLYAAGKIPGSRFIKREGRPSQEAVLAGRSTDRPIRPLFPKGFRNDVQVIVTVLSVDHENEPGLLSIIGASAALTISDIPFEGPVAAVKVGYIDDQLVLNPTFSQSLNSILDLTVVGTADALVMIEAGAKEVPEGTVMEALRFGHAALRDIVQLQERMREAEGKPKYEFPTHEIAEELRRAVADLVAPQIWAVIDEADGNVREAAREELLNKVVAELGNGYDPADVAAAFAEVEKAYVRSRILLKGQRPDGRDPLTIRPITCEVGVLPRSHGSGLFARGDTQVLTIATLGSVGDEQLIDGLGVEATRRFMHHYNFPPFCTGEVRRIGSPSRREIGHGALAERALSAVIPDEEKFPYTIRLVSEILSSNGSTSMASVCGSTLSLMDAGVPIAAPVAGISIGMVSADDGHYTLLSDIEGREDNFGDMDFKVAGTARGITAIQVDIKTKGLGFQIVEEALERARQGRLFILSRLLETISESRPDLSPYAPRVIRTSIPVDKIGALIGPGGKNIRSIQEQTGVKIDVEDDGGVFITSVDAGAAQKALGMVERLTKDVERGAVYLGRVTRVGPLGVFVEVLPGKEGLVRLSELAEYHASRPEDVVEVGDEIMVKVIEIDAQGRINLSRRALLEQSEERTPSSPRRPVGPPRSDYRPRPSWQPSPRSGPSPDRRPFSPRRGAPR